MSQNDKVAYRGVNSEGNKYTVYNDGRYYYSNVNSEGKTRSTYYNAGNGHAFCRGVTKDGLNYSFHENSNKGYRDYKFKVPAVPDEKGGRKSSKETRDVHISW